MLKVKIKTKFHILENLRVKHSSLGEIYRLNIINHSLRPLQATFVSTSGEIETNNFWTLHQGLLFIKNKTWEPMGYEPIEYKGFII